MLDPADEVINGVLSCVGEVRRSGGVVLPEPFFPCYQNRLDDGMSVGDTNMCGCYSVSRDPYIDDPLFLLIYGDFKHGAHFFVK